MPEPDIIIDPNQLTMFGTPMPPAPICYGTSTTTPGAHIYLGRHIAPPLPAQRHSPTSIAAAESMRALAGNGRAAVLNAILEHGPITDEQIAAITGLNPSTARPRRIELFRTGQIVQDGTAPTSSGRHAATWVVTPA